MVDPCGNGGPAGGPNVGSEAQWAGRESTALLVPLLASSVVMGTSTLLKFILSAYQGGTLNFTSLRGVVRLQIW